MKSESFICTNNNKKMNLNGDIQWSLFVFLNDSFKDKNINDKKVSRVNRNAKRRKTSLKNKKP